MNSKAHYINHSLNTSNFRNTCKFSKAERFFNPKNTETDYNYYVASRPSSRSTNFGVGSRPLNSSLNYAPGPDRYNVSKFPVDRRGTTLGYSRQTAIFGSLAHEVQRKAELPSPDTYNNVQMKGKSFSLGMKLPGQVQFAVKKRVPGPGQYKTLQINANGRYVSSKNKNTRCINFGNPSTDRPFTTQNTRTGPGSYDVFNFDSNFSDNKVKIMRRNTTRNFGTGNRAPVEDRTKDNNPGPGQYEPFSCFGGGYIPKVS